MESAQQLWLLFHSVKPGVWSPIYSDIFGRDLTGISWRMDAFGDDCPLLSIETYRSTGIQSIKEINLIYLEGEQAYKAFQLDTVTHQSPRMLEDGDEESWSLIQNFVLINYANSEVEQEPIIEVNGHDKTVVRYGQKIKTTKDKLFSQDYYWDSRTHSFIQKKKENPKLVPID